MIRKGDLSGLVRLYLAQGTLWCLMTNLIAALTGATSPITVAAGGMAGGSKVIAVALGIGRQILLWPLEVYHKAIRPLFG